MRPTCCCLLFLVSFMFVGEVKAQSTGVWSPTATLIGDVSKAGAMTPTTTPEGWEISSNASILADPDEESLYFASALIGEQGELAWQLPDAGDLPAHAVTGVMMRLTNATTAGAPFVFVGVRQGTPGVELIWRSLPGQAVQRAEGVISATDFPDGSILKLTWAGGRAFVSFQEGGVSNPPWQPRLAIELGAAPGVSPVFAGLAFGSSSSSGAAVDFVVEAEEVQFVEKVEAVRWTRVLEPYENLGLSGAQGTRQSMQAYEFESGVEDYATAGITATRVTGTPASSGTVEDFWRLGLSGATTTATEGFHFSQIVSYSEDVVDVYARLGEVGPQTALPSISMSRDDEVSPPVSALSGDPLGGGVWEFVGQFPAPETTLPTAWLTLSFTWELEDGVEDEFAFDGLLLVGSTLRPDGNADGLPDAFGSAYAQYLSADGDFDGDGRSNEEEFLFGSNPAVKASGSAALVFAKEAPLSNPWLLARGRWSAVPAEVEVTYSSGQPVQGYPVKFLHSTTTEKIGFGNPSDPAHITGGGLIALTDEAGVARTHVWLAPDVPDPTLPTLSPSHRVSAQLWNGDSSTADIHFEVKPYDNFPPGPVDVLSTMPLLTKISSRPDPVFKTLIVGEWLFAGEPSVLAEGSTTPSQGRVGVSRWDAFAHAWQPMGYFPLPPGLSNTAAFGAELLHDQGRVAVLGDGKVHFYALAEDGQTWEYQDATPTLGSGYAIKALRGDWLATVSEADRGSVSLYEKQSGGWTLVTTLLPGTGTFSDHFGKSLAFSEDAARLVIAAEGDPAWHLDPGNQPDYGHMVWYEWPVEEPMYDWVYDEYGNPSWVIVGYNYYMQGEWRLEPYIPTPPTPPSVYVFERTVSTWSLEAQIVDPSSGTAFFGASVAALSDWIWVGSPEIHSATFSVHGDSGSLLGYRWNATSLAWEVEQTYTRAAQNFGGFLAVYGDRLYVWTEDYADATFQLHLGFMDVLTVDATELSQLGEIRNTSAFYNARTPVGADEFSLWIRCLDTQTLLEEYAWLSSVPWDAPEETTVAGWATAFDGNLLSGVPASETLELSLTDDPPRWELTTAQSGETAPTVGLGQTAALALRLRDNADLPGMAPMIDWVSFTARDMAGDIYQELHGVRIRAETPSVPEITSATPYRRDSVELRWETPSFWPEVIIVEAASQAAVLDWEVEEGTLSELDELFEEVARIDASSNSYIHLLSAGISVGKAFRLRAGNSEGVSDAGDYLIVDLDGDDDGLPDWWEDLYGSLAPSGDADSDGLTNLVEYQKGTDPHVTDTDGDGYADNVDSAPLEFNANNLSVLVHTVLH